MTSETNLHRSRYSDVKDSSFPALYFSQVQAPALPLVLPIHISTVVAVLREFSGAYNAPQAGPLDLKGVTVGMQKAHHHPAEAREHFCVLKVHFGDF